MSKKKRNKNKTKKTLSGRLKGVCSFINHPFLWRGEKHNRKSSGVLCVPYSLKESESGHCLYIQGSMT